MAPPTPILSKEQVKKDQDQGSKDCQLKSLTQYQCQIFPPGSGEYVCVPFKRMFEECLKVSKTNKNKNKNRLDRYNGKSNITHKNDDTNKEHSIITCRTEITCSDTNT